MKRSTTPRYLKRTLSLILVFLMVFSSILINVPVSYAEEVQPTTVTYDFHMLGVGAQGTQDGWSIDPGSQITTYYDQSYGLQVENYSEDATISFNFVVPAASLYELKLSSALASGGCITSILVDDQTVGEYNFYSGTYIADTGLTSINTMLLTEGMHKLTFKAVSQPDGSWGYCMYPGKFVIVPVEAPTTLTYDFHKLGVETQDTQDGWSIADYNTTDGLYAAPYGLQIENYSADTTISFNFNVPMSSPYELQLSSALAAGGCIAGILVDDQPVGEYNFFSAGYVPDTGLKSIKTIQLGEGVHKLTFKAVSQPDGSWGYCMYPRLFVLEKRDSVPEPETLASIELTSDKSGLSIGDTAQLSITGMMSTNTVADLTGAGFEFTTSDSNIATVDNSTKILTALGNGTVAITAKVTLDGVAQEKSIVITVYNGALQSISANAENTVLNFAEYSQIIVNGTFSGDSTPVALNNEALTFTSSDETTIMVDSDGKVLAVGEGTADITVNANISGVEKSTVINFTGNETTTIQYDFHKLGVDTQGTQPCWEIIESGGNPALSFQPYGLQVENDTLNGEISFSFVAPADSPYQLQFSSALAGGGGVSSMMIDGVEIKQWDFYGSSYIADTGLRSLKTMLLTKGTHTLTMKAISQTSGSWGYRMYPGSFVLIKKDSIPVLSDITLSASIEELSKGQTSQITAFGTLSDGSLDNLSDATIGYTSSDETVVTVDDQGVVKAVGAGTANITANVKLDTVEISEFIQIVVNSETLKSIVLTADKTGLVVGQTAQLTVDGILTNDKSISLSDAAITYTSSNEAAAQVDGDGIVTAVGEGSADINVSATLGGVTQTNMITIAVEKVALKQVELASVDAITDIALGKTKQLKVSGIMNNDTAADLTEPGVTIAYSSENTDIATVDSSTGLVTANTVNEGSATIKVHVTLDGITKSSTIVINVFSWANVENTKQKISLYTAEKIAIARENIEKYSWAAAQKDNAVAAADQYAALEDEFLWSIVTPQTLPRSYTVNDAKGSPTSGTVIYEKYGNYPWIIDPVNHPWKIQDPVSKEYFPTNDFEAYYKSGLDDQGIFDKDLADESLLVNTLYPEKGESWGVDDGYGFIDTNGAKYTFIAYYNHWLWYNGFIQKALDSLRDAYIYTGDAKYAHSGTILLDRIADVYPSMDSSVYKWADGFQNSHGGTGLGKVVGSIWETLLVSSFIRAYDAFYPGMEDASIISFLSDKASQYGLENPKSASAAIKKNIEDGILRQVVPGVKNCQLEGNTGMEQSSVALAAVVIDALPETKEWLEFDFKERELYTNPRSVTGGDLWPILVDDLDRDGQGNEAAPGYTALWLDQLRQVADVIDGYYLEGLDFNADLYENPKFMKMFTAFYPLILSGRYTAQIGDTGAVGNPSIIASGDDCIQGFIKTGDPVLAQLSYYLNHNSINGIHADIFTKDPEKVAADIKSIIDTKGELKLNSSNMTGFGFAALRDGINYIKSSGITYQFANLNIVEQTADLTYFSNSGTMQFEALTDENHVTFSFDVANTNDYELDLRTFKATSYGIYDIYVDNQLLNTYDFYGSSGAGQQFDVIGEMALTAGTHTIKFVGHGKNQNAENSYKMGLIELAILDAEAQAIRDNSNEKGDTQRDAWIYYGRNVGHGHADTLNLGMHAFGLDIAPDLGYPEVTGEDPMRLEWVSNTISHNTVVVDKSKQSEQIVAQPKHFDDSTGVKLIDVEAPRVYKQTQMYRRTTAMIKVDDENSYTLDLFRVKGGNDHYYSFHSTDGTVSTDGLGLVAQPTGTYAGPDVEFGVRTDSVAGWGYIGSGFHYLKDVEKQISPQKGFSIDWKINDFRDVLPVDNDIHLKLTMLNDVNDVALANGVPPQRSNNPVTLKYLIAHRKGSNLNSLFTAIYQPYKDSPFIVSMTTVPVVLDGSEVTDGSAVAVKVVLKNGRTDYIVNALDATKTYIADGRIQFKGFFGVYSEKDGQQVYGYVNDGTVIGGVNANAGSVSGTVADFTKELSRNNELQVQLSSSNIDLNNLAGRYIYIENDGIRNASYRINSASVIDATHIALDLGDTTLIRSYADAKDFSKGYIYDVAVKSGFTIPLSSEQTIDPSDNVTIDSLNNLIDTYQNSGDIEKSMATELKARLNVVNHQMEKGSYDKAIKHMEDFVELLDKAVKQGKISAEAKDILSADANVFINFLNSK